MKTQTLKELAALAEYSEAANNGTLKEFAFFTKEVPILDENGKVIGTRNAVSAKKVGAATAGVAGAGALGYGGYKLDQAIMRNYGTRHLLAPVGGEVVPSGPLTAKLGRVDAYRAALKDSPNIYNRAVVDSAMGINKAGEKVGSAISIKGSGRLAKISRRAGRLSEKSANRLARIVAALRLR